MTHSHRLFQQWCDAAHRLAVGDGPVPANKDEQDADPRQRIVSLALAAVVAASVALVCI
jgi:hypothetical protein